MPISPAPALALGKDALTTSAAPEQGDDVGDYPFAGNADRFSCHRYQRSFIHDVRGRFEAEAGPPLQQAIEEQ